MNSCPRSRRGLTLTEVLMSSGLLALMAGPIIWMWITSVRADNILQAELEAGQAARTMLQVITRDVLLSRGLVRVPTLEREVVGLGIGGGRSIYYDEDQQGRLVRVHYDFRQEVVLDVTPVSNMRGRARLESLPGGLVSIHVSARGPSRSGADPKETTLTTAVRPRAW